ncbi:MAG: hypothetical protein IJV17_04070 [Prevotella sp.]|nr:hypothetical protein [Prevotella sp.]
MEDIVRLNVLWVDDQPKEDFMNEAYENGLEITPVKCVNSGMGSLKDKSKAWDAIILDANCKITDDQQEQPSLKALQNAIGELLQLRTNIPWFVYTGGDYEGVEHLEYMIKERSYDDRLYYEKPRQRYELFENIKKAVQDNDSYRIRQEYISVCNFYKNSDLVELLLRQEQEEFDTDPSIPNRVRQIIEWVMRYFDGRGLLPIAFTGTNIAKCSSSLGEIPQLVPIHVARSMHFCVEVCNNGSHADEIAANIVSGDAPYLNKSLILNLLNILHWCPSLQMYEVEELKKKVLQYQQETKDKREKRIRSAR